MSKMPTPDEIRRAIAVWRNPDLNPRLDMYDRGEAAARLLERVLEAQEEAIRPAETYTAAGIPRNAAARARAHGAKISHTLAGLRVDFPNGSSVHAFVDAGIPAKHGGTITRRMKGAAPLAIWPAGETLEDVLNNFADKEEGRAHARRN
jgi:hypothetical protein